MTHKNLSERIIKNLQNGSASIKEISDKLGIAWATINLAIEKLKNEGKVKETSTSRTRIIKLVNDPAFYGIPLTKEQKENTQALFHLIDKHWEEVKPNTKPLATIRQKIAVDVIRQANLNIPITPFHYGMVAPCVYQETPETKTPNFLNKKEVEEKIKEAIKTFKDKNTIKAMRWQYDTYNMKLFQAKENLIRSHLEKTEDTEIKEKLNAMFMAWPADQEESLELYQRFMLAVFKLISRKQLKKEEEQSHTKQVEEVFNHLWDLVTTQIFFDTIKKYIVPEKREIFDIIREEQINVKTATTDNQITELESLVATAPEHPPDMPQGDIEEMILSIDEEHI